MLVSGSTFFGRFMQISSVTAVILVLFGQLVSAAQLNQFSLFTIQSAHMERSDVQGSVVTGGDLTIRHYEIAGSQRLGAIIGGALSLDKGQIRGNTELQGGASGLESALIHGHVQSAESVHLSSAQIRGTLTSRKRPRIENGAISHFKKAEPRFSVSIADLAQEFRMKSAGLAQLEPNTIVQRIGMNLVIQATQALSVVKVTSQELRRQNLIIQAVGVQQIVIQIEEPSVDLSDVTLTLIGLQSEKVSWVMDTARSLMIQRTGDPSIGLPGFFYAPNAYAQFYEGLITGGLYVNRLGFIPELGMKSGQINGIPAEQSPLN